MILFFIFSFSFYSLDNISLFTFISQNTFRALIHFSTEKKIKNFYVPVVFIEKCKAKLFLFARGKNLTNNYCYYFLWMRVVKIFSKNTINFLFIIKNNRKHHTTQWKTGINPIFIRLKQD